MSAPIPSVPSTTVFGRPRRPRVADRVVHVRARVVGDRARAASRSSNTQCTSNQSSAASASSRAPASRSSGPSATWMCTPTPRSAASPAAASSVSSRARERGMHADQPAPTGAQEALVLGQPAARPVGTVPIGHAVRADHAHADLGACLGDHVEAALDRVRALVVVDDRGRPRHQRLGRAEQRAGADHVEVEGGVEAPPDLLEDLAETRRLAGRRRHAARQRRVEVVVGAHHARRRRGHRFAHYAARPATRSKVTAMGMGSWPTTRGAPTSRCSTRRSRTT